MLIFFEDELTIGLALGGRDICRHHAVGVRREALEKVGRGGRKRGLRVRGAVNARNAHAHLRGGAEIARQRERRVGSEVDVALRVALNARRAGENKIATVLYINRTVTRRRIALDRAAPNGKRRLILTDNINCRAIDRFAAGNAHPVQQRRASIQVDRAAVCRGNTSFNATAIHIQMAAAAHGDRRAIALSRRFAAFQRYAIKICSSGDRALILLGNVEDAAERVAAACGHTASALAVADVQNAAGNGQCTTIALQLKSIEAKVDRFALVRCQRRRNSQVIRQVVIPRRRELIARCRIRFVQGLPLGIRRMAFVRARHVTTDRVIGMDRGRRLTAALFALARILRGGSCVLRFDHHVRRRSDRCVLRRDDHAAH